MEKMKLLLLLLLTDICLRKLMYITNAHAVNSHEKILLSPEKKRFKEFFETIYNGMKQYNTMEWNNTIQWKWWNNTMETYNRNDGREKNQWKWKNSMEVKKFNGSESMRLASW